MRHLRLIVLLSIFIFSFQLTGGKDAQAAIVLSNQVYTYEKMQQDIVKIAQTYPDLVSYKVIGKSEYGRNIYAVSLGKGDPAIFINGSHHAREWLTTTLNMTMIEQYAGAYKRGAKISGYDVRSILDKTTIWFVPMVNPDGVTLQQFGLKAFPASIHNQLKAMNGGSSNFGSWKANAKGVDLNRQYNADWENIKFNPGKPSYKNFKGTQPESAAEVKAVLAFVKEINPEASVAYHSSGEILYWNFKQTGYWYDRDHAYAKNIRQMTGYGLVYPGLNPSGGGFTDWFIIAYKRPGFTPEIGRAAGERSLPVSEFSRVWSQNQGVGLYVANLGYQLNTNRNATAVKQASAQVSTAISKAARLRVYYSTNISSTDDLKVSSSMAGAYQLAAAEIGWAEKVIKTLPVSNQNLLNAKLEEARAHKTKAAVFIDTMKSGQALLEKRNNLAAIFNDSSINDDTVRKYHELSSQLRKTELFINRLYGPHVRKYAAEKFALPAKVAKENVIYEVSRYLLINEITAMIETKDIASIELRLAELERLERRSVEIKAAGNKLYPGKYGELPLMEKTLQEMKEELLKQFEQLKKVSETPL
jgi:g-D-glutamyl-meso-diaminopimelate peptidase